MRPTFACEAPRSPRISHIWRLNNHPVSVKQTKNFNTSKIWSPISPTRCTFKRDPNPPPRKNSLCRFTLISGMVLGGGKNLKSDNYLKIFIPDFTCSLVIQNTTSLLEHRELLGHTNVMRTGCNLVLSCQFSDSVPWAFNFKIKSISNQCERNRYFYTDPC